MIPDYTKCPDCGSSDVEIMDNMWICFDCSWNEIIEPEEKEED